MNGTYKCGRRYRSLALFVLGCAYFAVAPLSALAQGAGGKGVSVTVNPTTGYAVINSSTVSTPRGTNIGPSGGPPSVNVRPSGGLSQSLPSGIEITGLRQNAQTLRGPLGVNLNAGLNALKNGAVRCLTSMRCTTALGLGSIGLQALLDTMDWELGPDGRPIAQIPSPVNTEGPDEYYWLINRPGALSNIVFSSGSQICPAVHSYYSNSNWIETVRTDYVSSTSLRCLASGGGQTDVEIAVATRFGDTCPDGTDYYESIGGCSFEPQKVPVSASDIESIVDSSYTPDPTDWNWLTGGLDFSAPDVTIEITDIPVLDGSNEPNFIEWSDGTSRGTFNTYTPTVTNNGSHKPEISVKDEQTEISYDNQGNPTGSSTSTTVTPPSTSTGGGGAPAAEVPTDCDFMPTVCRFIDWFTEPDALPDPDQEIRDLVQVYEDGGRTVDLGPSTGSCPPPRTIALSFVPAVEVSFQPFCDLAAAVRFWLLAIAYFGAAYLTVRSI